MKKSTFGLALLALTAHAFAADNEITVPALTPIPIIVSTSEGDHFQAIVENWGTLGGNTEGIAKVGIQVAEELRANQCTVLLKSHRDQTGRMQPFDGLANFLCKHPEGDIVVKDVPGFLVDSTGNQGLKAGEVGEKAFYIVESHVTIPVASK